MPIVDELVTISQWLSNKQLPTNVELKQMIPVSTIIVSIYMVEKLLEQVLKVRDKAMIGVWQQAAAILDKKYKLSRKGDNWWLLVKVFKRFRQFWLFESREVEMSHL